MKLFALAFLLTCAPIGVIASTGLFQEIVPRTLQSGRLLIVWRSSGCFHDEAFELRFRPIDEFTVAVSVVSLKSQEAEAGSSRAVAREEVGTITLVSRDIERFGRLLEFYDKPRDQFCTTVDQIEVLMESVGSSSLLLSGKDGSCSLLERLDVLTFGEMVERAKAVGQAGSGEGGEPSATDNPDDAQRLREDH